MLNIKNDMKKNWKFVVDPKKTEEGSIPICLKVNGKLAIAKMVVNKNENTIYVDIPIEKPSVRARLKKLADRA